MARGGRPGGMGNMQQLMAQAQKMQVAMEQKKQELEAMTISASSGGGMVTAEVNGSHRVTSINIDPEAVDPEDVEMLQDMIQAAVNEAMQKIDEVSDQEMAKLAGGMNIPGL